MPPVKGSELRGKAKAGDVLELGDRISAHVQGREDGDSNGAEAAGERARHPNDEDPGARELPPTPVHEDL